MVTQAQPNLHEKINKGGGGDFEDLPLLPEREWLKAGIVDVAYIYAEYKGQPQYVTDKDGEIVTDSSGNPIQRKQFKITFEFMDYEIKEGSPRKAWLRLGASFHEKAHLPKLLEAMGIEDYDEMTPQQIIDALIGQACKLQLENRLAKDGSKTYQNVIPTAVKKLEEEIAWDE